MRSSPLLLLGAALSQAAPNCPPLGPAFQKPTSLLSDPIIKDALANLTSIFSARDNDNSASVLANSTSWSIEVFSTNPDSPTLWEWHHTAPELAVSNTTGVKKVDGNTVYRLGSLTKVFTVLTWLVQDGMAKWNDPITNYVPELREAAERARREKDPVRNIPWDEVTIGALAGQMSGAIRDYGLMGEMTQQYDQSDAVALGFPPLDSSDKTLPPCGAWPLCNRTEFFQGLLQAYPSYAPFTTPAYTNTGYQILAYALESIKGDKKFGDMMQDSVLNRLGLNHTYYVYANESVGVVPGNASDAGWYWQLGDENPAGNMYSSTTDLSTLGRSILSSTLLPPSLSQSWLKPLAFTSELYAGLSTPWGVRRIPHPLYSPSTAKRVVDSFNKAGRIGYYSSLMTLLPDYDIGFSILIAGPAIPGNTNFNLADILGRVLLPALERSARAQTSNIFAGTYTDPNRNSSLRLTTDAQRPGLGIENWVSNNTDMQAISVALSVGYNPIQGSIRLYPTGLETVRQDGSKKVAFKAVYEDIGLPARPYEENMFSTDCGTWVSFTGVTYGTHALDQFVFELDKSGKVASLESLALRSVMRRQSSS
ncbi:D-alanyl-D-alanine-carboxypeptidase/endopeptidase AmpH [Podospora australis]|uniref:D-alanyl-D-alanine-carboxypeptidase/endopeptidase AmpH n=1 Tax=Podospora australis TaxID=1536484 RepID=A0AAN6WTN5_9PEZI|nr:D-alanyl-D-alanine-carboxypeptidase/endopeptidase AmpH [Podospora australis]